MIFAQGNIFLEGFQAVLQMIMNFFTYLARNFISAPVGVLMIGIWLLKVFSKVRAGQQQGGIDTGWLALVDDIVAIITLSAAASGQPVLSVLGILAYLTWSRLYTDQMPGWNEVWREKIKDDVMALALVGLGSLIIFNTVSGGQLLNIIWKFFSTATASGG